MRFHLVHLQPHFLRCDYTFCLRGSTFYLSFQLMFWNFCLNWSISKRQGFDLSRHDLALLSPRRELATSLNGSSDNWCWPIDDLMDWGTLLVPSVSFRLILLYFCDEYGPFKVRYCFSCWTHVCCSSFRQQQNTGKQQIICSMPLNYTIKVSGGSKKDFLGFDFTCQTWHTPQMRVDEWCTWWFDQRLPWPDAEVTLSNSVPWMNLDQKWVHQQTAMEGWLEPESLKSSCVLGCVSSMGLPLHHPEPNLSTR